MVTHPPPLKLSVIVTTYNRSDALARCLDGLYAQTERDFEILIADDGSNASHRNVMAYSLRQSPVPIQHVYHDDQGFRAAAIRNRAVAASHGDYLLFLDGDCVPFPSFIVRHRRLARPKHFVPGNRLLLSARLTQWVLHEAFPLHEADWRFWLRARLRGDVNRLLPLWSLPLGALRRLQPHKWQHAMTCNLGVWKRDFLAVNGFDESFSGWGYEDSDLVIRLLHAGVQRLEGRFAVPVCHLWHPPNDPSRREENWQRLMARLKRPDCIRAERGVDQYAA